MVDVRSLHKGEYNEEPEVVVSTPGIITLMGEYTDLCDGYVLTGALDKYASIAVSRRKDNSLRFYAGDQDERKRTTIPNLKYRREDRWANYIKGVLYEVYRRNYEFRGLNITLYGEIPQKVGLKSSTAICVSTALALKKLLKVEIADNQLIQSIYFAENSFMQSKSRLVDIMSMLYAQEGELLLFDLHSLDYKYIPFNPGRMFLMVTDSNLPPFPIKEEIQYREDECRLGFDDMKKRQPHGMLRDLSDQDAKNLAVDLPEERKRFCLHVLEESRRVLEAVKVLELQDYAAFGRLLNRSQESIRDKFELTCPEIDWLTKRAMELTGCYGSKMIGEGFGGCTITLLEMNAHDAYKERLEEYEHIFGFHPIYFDFSAANGTNGT